MQIKLGKYLANNGVGARRKVGELIKNGRVLVNDKVPGIGDSVDPEKDEIKVDGQLIAPAKNNLEYIILNKPLNVLSSVSDDRGRTTVADLVKTNQRLYPVGRLDYNSTGLILLTNDGDLALKLTHPRYHVPKVYQVTTKEPFLPIQLEKMQKGVEIYDKKTAPVKIEKINKRIFQITLHEGMKRQIREMCKVVGLTVTSLHRIKIGNLDIENLESGKYRTLTKVEISRLKGKGPIKEPQPY